jgi:Organic solute transporter Ostalpha
MQFNITCNSTLEDLRSKTAPIHPHGAHVDHILVTSETPIAGSLTFHDLGLIISGGCSVIAICLSLFLIWMHALHYTKPYEQRQ